jgi:hypothetical protein
MNGYQGLYSVYKHPVAYFVATVAIEPTSSFLQKGEGHGQS